MARSRWCGSRFGELQLGAAGILLACLLSTPVTSQGPLPQALRDGRAVFVEHPTGEACTSSNRSRPMSLFS